LLVVCFQSDHVWFDCMLCAVGSLAGERRLRSHPQIFKNNDFFQKKYPHKTKYICLVMRFSLETTKKTNVKKISLMLQDIFLNARQCLRTVCCIWFRNSLFNVCLMHCAFLKNIAIFWHKQTNWTNCVRISIWSEDTDTKKTISPKSHNNARNYIW